MRRRRGVHAPEVQHRRMLESERAPETGLQVQPFLGQPVHDRLPVGGFPAEDADINGRVAEVYADVDLRHRYEHAGRDHEIPFDRLGQLALQQRVDPG